MVDCLGNFQEPPLSLENRFNFNVSSSDKHTGTWALSRAAGEYTIWHKLSVFEVLEFCIALTLQFPS